MNVFENNPTMEREKAGEELAIERAIEDARSRILRKTNEPEIAKFFNEMDQKNLKMLNLHPENGKRKILEVSRDIMHKVKQNPQIITRNVRFFHSKQAL